MPTERGLDVGRWLLAPRSARDAYLLAAASVAAMTLVRLALGAFLADIVPFGTFFIAVLFSATAGGLGPGLFALLSSAVVSALLFVPDMAATPIPLKSLVNFGVFLLSGGCVALLGAAMRGARAERAEAERLFGVVHALALDGFVIYRAMRDQAGRVIDFERIFMNRAAEKMIGPAEEMVGRTYLATSPTAHREQLFQNYLRVLETGVRAEDEFLFENGGLWVYNVAARIDAERIAITFRDITAAKQIIGQQNLLLRELNHRVKNVLMMAMSLARLTSTQGTAREYRDALMARIGALGRAHDLLMTESWEGALLEDLVAQTLEPYRRVTWSGPRLTISPESAISLNMMLYELATNAAKYGALSSPEGRVEITWTQPAEGEALLCWRERGGPPVTQPERHGLGSRLLKSGMSGSPTRTDLRYLPDGVECDISFVTAQPEARSQG
ncbi:DUF4118 domain-containing protein [Alsobacter sp. SYSU M60028]|uniref:Blue-light-activated histidine kinase n=1 Tax=Alsobacter ponti TaxID=2962936 RepID=A0ABT1LKX7_9HYPH|nr:HWE histidine kinase domain-containing protein [Alsobacter ponti]MCP8940908.1 DUF4118 domain-containing protein [Alsobacter ponti]